MLYNCAFDRLVFLMHNTDLKILKRSMIIKFVEMLEILMHVEKEIVYHM